MGKTKMLVDDSITNIKKFYWYDTQAYKFSGDNNKGYIYGYVEWYGNQQLDDALDGVYEEYTGTEVEWTWFKTVQERDKKLKEISK